MGKRGRKSETELSVVDFKEAPEPEKPEPPEHLGDEQKAEWERLVESFPASHFPAERFALLESYVNHTVNERRIAEMIDDEANGDLDPDRYEQLLKMHKEQSAKIGMLSVRLGFAYSTAYEKRKSPDKGQKPWES